MWRYIGFQFFRHNTGVGYTDRTGKTWSRCAWFVRADAPGNDVLYVSHHERRQWTGVTLGHISSDRVLYISRPLCSITRRHDDLSRSPRPTRSTVLASMSTVLFVLGGRSSCLGAKSAASWPTRCSMICEHVAAVSSGCVGRPLPCRRVSVVGHRSTLVSTGPTWPPGHPVVRPALLASCCCRRSSCQCLDDDRLRLIDVGVFRRSLKRSPSP